MTTPPPVGPRLLVPVSAITPRALAMLAKRGGWGVTPEAAAASMVVLGLHAFATLAHSEPDALGGVDPDGTLKAFFVEHATTFARAFQGPPATPDTVDGMFVDRPASGSDAEREIVAQLPGWILDGLVLFGEAFGSTLSDQLAGGARRTLAAIVADPNCVAELADNPDCAAWAMRYRERLLAGSAS